MGGGRYESEFEGVEFSTGLQHCPSCLQHRWILFVSLDWSLAFLCIRYLPMWHACPFSKGPKCVSQLFPKSDFCTKFGTSQLVGSPPGLSVQVNLRFRCGTVELVRVGGRRRKYGGRSCIKGRPGVIMFGTAVSLLHMEDPGSSADSSSKMGTAEVDRLRVGWLSVFFIGEGFHESRRCSMDTYPESNITECI